MHSELEVKLNNQNFPSRNRIWKCFHQNGSHFVQVLTHWGWVTHICVCYLTIIGSDNGLSPDWRQAIIWTNAGILLIGPLGASFSEIVIEIHTFSLKNVFENIVWKMAAFLSRPQCVALNVQGPSYLGLTWSISSWWLYAVVSAAMILTV